MKSGKINMAFSKTQTRVLMVLSRIGNMVKRDEDYAEIWQNDLDMLISDMHNDDAFGTEGQGDPRGDFRDGTWSMWNVQGVDDVK